VPQLRIGKNLQLLIAAADDLSATLAPLREQRKRRNVKLAAGLGGATSVLTSSALLAAANIGFWASLGVALGVGTIPLLVGVGAGAFTLGFRKKRAAAAGEALREQVTLTYACFAKMANADGRISDEEKVLLRSVLLQYPLTDEERAAVEQVDPDAVLANVERYDTMLRRRVLQGTWMLAEADGVAAEEEQLFVELAAKLGQSDEVRELKRMSRALQAEMNDLVTGMFRTCQQVLSPELGTPPVNEFLEALAQIAATPPARRSLRNSLSSGFSAGGVVQTLNEHGQSRKLVAQAANAVLAVYDEGEQRKGAENRLLELADASELGKREARQIYADVHALFGELADDPGEDATTS
jgi:tellurite resistance protein